MFQVRFQPNDLQLSLPTETTQLTISLAPFCHKRMFVNRADNLLSSYSLPSPVLSIPQPPTEPPPLFIKMGNMPLIPLSLHGYAGLLSLVCILRCPICSCFKVIQPQRLNFCSFQSSFMSIGNLFHSMSTPEYQIHLALCSCYQGVCQLRHRISPCI